MRRSSGSNENGTTRGTRGFLLGEHGTHRRQRRLDHDIVALLLEPYLEQHLAHRDIDGRAAGIGRNHATLHVFKALHRPVGEHHIFLRVVGPVLNYPIPNRLIA